MSSKNEKSKENAQGILKPLAAAFFATEPEEDDKLLTPKPVAKKTPSKPSVKEPDPLLGELSTEEARALLKEQLVGRISNEIGITKETAKKSEEKVTAEKTSKAAVKETKDTEKSSKKESVKTSVKVTSDVKAAVKKIEVVAGKAETVTKAKAEKPAAGNAKAEKTAAKTTKASKKETAAQTPIAPSIPEEIHMEYAGQSYDMDELVAKAVQVWTSVYKRSRRELWSVELYVKPEENKAYYVLNKRKNGSIDL